MPVVRISLETILAGQVCLNTFHYFHPTHIPTPTDVAELLDDFELDVVPAIKAITTARVTFNRLIGYAYNLGFSMEESLAGAGSIADVDGSLTIPPDIAAIIKRNLGSTYLNEGGALYVGNRQLRQSRIFLSGLPTVAMTDQGLDTSALPAGTWANFSTAMQAVLSTTTFAGSWYHNAFGFRLDELPPTPSFPDGKPERPDVVAPVVGILDKGFTNLHTREN